MKRYYSIKLILLLNELKHINAPQKVRSMKQAKQLPHEPSSKSLPIAEVRRD